MATSILYVGVDVDDSAFHIAGFDPQASKFFEYKCPPTHGALRKRLEKLEARNYTVRVCYEATYIGFPLCRLLLNDGYSCEVIAPSLIPVVSSSRIKTDKIDSRKLAEYYSKDLLTPVVLPDEFDEQTRRLIRSRAFLVQSRKKVKQHILSNCRLIGINYRQETNAPNANYWTKKHLLWLNSKVKDLSEIDSWILDKLMSELNEHDLRIDQFISKIEELAESERYHKQCAALNCFKGLNTLSSISLITELGDINRFDHPKRIVSYAGLDIREYSSGGKEKKFGITKMGNKYIRTVLTEACQTITLGSTVGKQLRTRRSGIAPEIVSIAERCQERLYKKRTRLLLMGKVPNKIKTACAREMIGFIWEALRMAA